MVGGSIPQQASLDYVTEVADSEPKHKLGSSVPLRLFFIFCLDFT